MYLSLKNFFLSQGLNDVNSNILGVLLTILVVLLLILFLSIIINKIVLKIVYKGIRKTKTKWDDALIETDFFKNISYIIPAIIVYLYAESFEEYGYLIHRFTVAYIITILLLTLSSLLNAVNIIYKTFDVSKQKPIKGYLQVIKIISFIFGGIFIVGTLINKSPVGLLSGIGAFTAILMLVFKDSILGLVAGIQITNNRMVHIGDWIEMPKYSVDGDVIDINLTTIKVQNWDKTISSVPVYALVSDSFKNWRGMQEAKGRRIKRSIYIDINSIEFCDEKMLSHLKKINLLKEYIEEKTEEIDNYNSSLKVKDNSNINQRKLTNVGTFRMYLFNYLKQNKNVNPNLTLLVRQLQSTEKGLPIELYCFTNDTIWANYERIQADIFDHIFAIAPEFNLQIFQNPSGEDFRKFIG